MPKSPSNPPPKKPDWAPAFLTALADKHMVTRAAQAAGIHRDTAYHRRKHDEQFAQAWDDIVERSTEELEREAYRRAHDGVEKPIYHQGVRVDTVREYSDTLLIFLLKARRPGVYRDRVEHTGAGGGPLDHRVRLDLSQLTDEQLTALEQIRPADDAAGTQSG